MLQLISIFISKQRYLKMLTGNNLLFHSDNYKTALHFKTVESLKAIYINFEES